MMFFRRQKKQKEEPPSRPHIKIRVIDSQDHESVGTPMNGTDIPQKEELEKVTDKDDPAREPESIKTGGRCGFITGN